MADMLVLKIKHNGTLRRVSLPKGLELSYDGLQKKIRDLFSFAADTSLSVTYVDNEGDVVTIADDNDVLDAIVHQGLNPLRLEVCSELKTVAPASVASTVTEALQSAGASPIKVASPEVVVQSKTESEVQAAASASPRPSASAASAVSAAPAGSAGPAPVERKPVAPVAEPVPVVDRVTHHGVQCDACGVIPVTGPRFKSNTKNDYDLCRSCFEKDDVVKSEYNRIDRPLFRPRVGHPFWQNARPLGSRHGLTPAHPFLSYNQLPYIGGPGGATGFGGRPFHQHRGGGGGYNRGHENRFSEGKLDGRFVTDVSVHDGTEFTPNTNFVKIWRLRNSGTLPWPMHTQLVYVGGDQLGSTDSVTLQIGEEGLACGEEIEAALELTAPERPGRYVSHWRLLAPNGPKFGHRVWALIQVVASGDPSPQVANSALEASKKDSGLPLASSSGSSETHTELGALIQADVAALLLRQQHHHQQLQQQQQQQQQQEHEDAEAVAEVRSEMADLLSAVHSIPLNRAIPIPSPVPDGRKVYHGLLARNVQVQKQDAQTEEGSLGGFSMVNMPSGDTCLGEEVVASVTSFVLPPAAVEEGAPSLNGRVAEAGNGEDAELMVAQLVQMGFMDPVLNLAVLKQNDMQMQKALDELVSVAEWDPMMEELEEMGFVDKTMNRRLMFKNKGEKKLVVKDLVHIYKSAGGRK